MLERKIERPIKEWITKGTTALLVTGVRQCGKTTIIRNVMKETNTEYAEINLIDRKEMVPVFNSAIEEGADAFLTSLRFAIGKKLNDGAIIFIDEVQECKDIVTVIKFLVDKGQYKYILSGSLLGIELTGLRSAPVGYLTILSMYPMDFEEFLIMNHSGEEVIEYIRNCYEKIIPVPESMHTLLMNYFYRYLLIGGMPQAVQAFQDTSDLNVVTEIHEQIINLYKNDFTKYEKEKKLKLIKTYELIPSELDEKNKRYMLTDLEDKSAKFNRYENSFNWLNDAGVSIPAYNVTEFQIPLTASKKSNLFKLFLSDVGLLTTMYGTPTKIKLMQKSNEINNGALFENVVAQELQAHGYKLYYFNNKKHGEVDFLIENEGELLPIEVKSGKDYMQHSALSYFMSTKQFRKAFVFSNYNVSVQGNIIYFPIYMTMFLNHHKKLQMPEALSFDSVLEEIKRSKEDSSCS